MDSVNKHPKPSQALAAKYSGLFALHDTAPGLETKTKTLSKGPLAASPDDVFTYVPDGPAKVAAREVIASLVRHPIRIYRTGEGFGIQADQDWKRANWAGFRRTALLFWEEAFEVVVTSFGWLIQDED